jgi:hypothetical protein
MMEAERRFYAAAPDFYAAPDTSASPDTSAALPSLPASSSSSLLASSSADLMLNAHCLTLVDALHGIDDVTKRSIYLIDRAMGAYADADTNANESPTSERVKSAKFKSGTPCGRMSQSKPRQSPRNQNQISRLSLLNIFH